MDVSVVSVVFCQVEVSATSWSLVQRSHTDCGASLCEIQKPREWGGSGPMGAVAPNTNKNQLITNCQPHHYNRSQKHSYVTTQYCPLHFRYNRVRLYLQVCPLRVTHDLTTAIKLQLHGSGASGLSLKRQNAASQSARPPARAGAAVHSCHWNTHEVLTASQVPALLPVSVYRPRLRSRWPTLGANFRTNTR
jgi:hypothetical protein